MIYSVIKGKSIQVLSTIKTWAKERELFLLSIIIFAILVTTPLAEKIAFIPDYLNLSQVKSKDYFGLIIGAIASIFGILMAVILLTVEFFKEKLDKNKHTNPLDNKLIRNSIYNSINLIGLSFISYILFDDFNISKNLTIGYFLGIIFIAYIYSVYPVLRKIINNSSQIKNNIELTNILDLNSFKIASRPRVHKNNETNETLKTLKKQLDLYILSNNVSAYEKINSNILSKGLQLISNGQNNYNCGIVIDGLIWLWRQNLKVAIRVNDDHYFELIWIYIKEIYTHFANQKTPLSNLEELNYFIEFDLLKLHIKLNNSTPLSTALDCVEVSFIENLKKNCPRQEDLVDLIHAYEGGDLEYMHDYTPAAQWRNLKDLLHYIAGIQESAIKLDDKDIFEESSRRIETICTKLNFHMISLGSYQKGNLTWQILSHSFNNSHKALKSEMYENTKDCLRVPQHLMKRLIEDGDLNNKDIRIIIRTLADNIVLAYKDDKLFTNAHFGTLREFSLIGINCLKSYKKDKTAKQIVKYIIKVLIHLKDFAEKDLSSINPNDYLAIKKRIKHFADVAKKLDDFKEDEKPIKKWIEVYNDFKNVVEEVDFGIVKWKVD
ncbi:MAG: hypothetical protein JXR05_08800 [Flavobacteriaceae bacterium]